LNGPSLPIRYETLLLYINMATPPSNMTTLLLLLMVLVFPLFADRANHQKSSQRWG
jgi:hypothetical protein